MSLIKNKVASDIFESKLESASNFVQSLMDGTAKIPDELKPSGFVKSSRYDSINRQIVIEYYDNQTIKINLDELNV